MSTFILASQSIGRKQLLTHLGVPFRVLPSSIDEETILAKTPVATIKLRAQKKGKDVVQKVNNETMKQLSNPKNIQSLTTDNRQPITFILSADSGAILNGELIGKPKDEKDAYRIFRFLSGKTHEFITAVYMVQIGQMRQMSQIRKTILLEDISTSFVTFRNLTDEDIKRYIKVTDYTKYAGGYAIASSQDFITNIKGSISNVIGLPLEKLLPLLPFRECL